MARLPIFDVGKDNVAIHLKPLIDQADEINVFFSYPKGRTGWPVIDPSFDDNEDGKSFYIEIITTKLKASAYMIIKSDLPDS